MTQPIDNKNEPGPALIAQSLTLNASDPPIFRTPIPKTKHSPTPNTIRIYAQIGGLGIGGKNLHDKKPKNIMYPPGCPTNAPIGEENSTC